METSHNPGGYKAYRGPSHWWSSVEWSQPLPTCPGEPVLRDSTEQTAPAPWNQSFTEELHFIVTTIIRLRRVNVSDLTLFYCLKRPHNQIVHGQRHTFSSVQPANLRKQYPWKQPNWQLGALESTSWQEKEITFELESPGFIQTVALSESPESRCRCGFSGPRRRRRCSSAL